MPPSVGKVKEIYHIYRSGSGTSSPSCNLPHYGSTSKQYNPYSRYQDHYGSNRSNGVRILKFGDTLTEKSIENEVDEDCNTESKHDEPINVETNETLDEIIPSGSGWCYIYLIK